MEKTEKVSEVAEEIKVEVPDNEEIKGEKKDGCPWKRFRGCRRSPKQEESKEKEHPRPWGFPGSHGFFGGHQSEVRGPFGHSEFRGFPGFEHMKAKFDWAITKKIEEMMPCIVNKVKNAL